MKKLLYAILVIEIIGAIIGFFAVALTSLITAVLVLPFILISFVPIIAIIINFENIEKLQEEVAVLRYQNSEKQRSGVVAEAPQETPPPAVDRKETARGAWECVKCGTVNKAGTTHCSNCKADYSPWTNPTTSPSAKKKLSRWVK